MKNILLLIFILTSCTHYLYESNRMNEFENALVKTAANEVALSNNILYKSFAYLPDVGFVYLVCFDSYERPDIPEARQLYINIMEQLISNIRNQGLTYITADNLNIRLHFVEENGCIHKDESLTFVDNSEKHITYYFNYNQTNRLKPMHAESYEEALRILNAQKSDNSDKPRTITESVSY